MNDIHAALADAIAEVCGIDPSGFHADSRLEDIGIDSLASAEVLVAVEIRLGKQLPGGTLRRLQGVATVGEVAALLEEAFAPRSSPEAV